MSTTGAVTRHSYRIYYASRELAKELGDPLLGVVEAGSAEDAVRKAERDPDIGRRAMPCCSLWAVRIRDEDGMTPQRQPPGG